MGYQMHRSGHHVVVRWTETPTVAMISQLHTELESARKAAGALLVCFIVIPADDVDLPGSEARQVIQARQRDLYAQSESVDIVLIGDSLRASLIRTTLRAMALVTRTGERLRIHDGAEEALKGRSVPASVAKALRGTATV
jgi:hypothetical protein